LSSDRLERADQPPELLALLGVPTLISRRLPRRHLGGEQDRGPIERLRQDLGRGTRPPRSRRRAVELERATWRVWSNVGTFVAVAPSASARTNSDGPSGVGGTMITSTVAPSMT
jgi:hypothetical protein